VILAYVLHWHVERWLRLKVYNIVGDAAIWLDWDGPRWLRPAARVAWAITHAACDRAGLVRWAKFGPDPFDEWWWDEMLNEAFEAYPGPPVAK
jgi:hypothetical protein